MRKITKKASKTVDKTVITPISRFIYFFKKKLNKSRGWLDQLLNKPRFLIYLSLMLSVIVFLLVDSKVINLVESQAEVIRDLNVVVKYNEEAYVIEGVPETVDITMTGRKSDIYLARNLAEYQVELDLSNYQASDSPYKVDFKYTKSVDNLNYTLSPSFVNVIIRQKVSDMASVQYDLFNLDSLDPKLNVSSVVLDRNEVAVKGSEETLEKIASVKALVDLDNKILTESGNHELTDVNLVAYDNQGKILENVEIVPSSINATVSLDSYSKTLPVQITTTGNLIAGKAIASIQISGSDSYSITAYGDKSDLEDLNYLPVSIDIDGLGKDSTKTYNISLSKPSGVRYLSDNTVKVSVTFANEEQKSIDIGSKIITNGLSDSLTANVASGTNVSVQVKGVSSVIETITEEDISAYVDLSGLTKGEHTVEVKIDNKNPLVTYIVSSTITVIIS